MTKIKFFLLVPGLLFLAIIANHFLSKRTSAENILLAEDNFEDGNFNVSDQTLTGGLSWTVQGTARVGTSTSWPSKMLQLYIGAKAYSNQTVTSKDFTLVFDTINWYRSSHKVKFAFIDERNHYYFSPSTGGVYRVFDGTEEKLTNALAERYLIMPRANPSRDTYKIYFKNADGKIMIEIDKNGYANGLDYEFSFEDKNALAVSRFNQGGKISLSEEGTGTYSYWVNFDNIQVFAGKRLAVSPRASGVLYVDKAAGNDTNPGTSSAPFATIAKAISSSLPGDEIVVRDGQYEEQLTFAAYDKVYATGDKRLTIRAANQRKAAINGANFKYADYVTLDGFEVVKSSLNVGGSREVKILNNYIHDLPGLTGIEANGEYGHVSGNYIYKTNKGMNVGGKNMLVENNEIERLIWVSQDADYFRFFGEGHVIRNNYMHGTLREEIGPSHTDGFQTFDNNGEYVRHIIIEGNFIEDFYAQGFMGEGEYYYHSYDLTFRNNVFKDAGAWGLCISSIKDVKVYNNIFINFGIHGVGFSYDDPAEPSTGEVFNNIFYDGGSLYWASGGSTIKSGNNLIYFTKKTADATKYPNDIVNADPLMMDVAKKDFRLHPSSPGVDAGASLASFSYDREGVTRPQGAAWDIGPYETVPYKEPVAYISSTDSFGNPDFQGYYPYTIHFSGAGSFKPAGTNLTEYRWNFGDGSQGVLGEKVDHEFQAGTYKVTLTVKDNLNRTNTAERMVTVWPSTNPNNYLWLKFDGNYQDESGKNMSVAWGGTPLYDQGVSGQAARFNQADSRGVNVAHSDYLDGWEKFTMAFWAKKDNPAQSVNVIVKHVVYNLSVTANGFAVNYINNDQGQSTKLSYSQGPSDGNWHHYVLTYDGADLRLYFDGGEVASAPFTGRIKRDRTRGLTFGRDPWGASLNGLMDEIKFYDRALSLAEIRTLFGIKDPSDHIPGPPTKLMAK